MPAWPLTVAELEKKSTEWYLSQRRHGMQTCRECIALDNKALMGVVASVFSGLFFGVEFFLILSSGDMSRVWEMLCFGVVALFALCYGKYKVKKWNEHVISRHMSKAAVLREYLADLLRREKKGHLENSGFTALLKETEEGERLAGETNAYLSGRVREGGSKHLMPALEHAKNLQKRFGQHLSRLRAHKRNILLFFETRSDEINTFLAPWTDIEAIKTLHSLDGAVTLIDGNINPVIAGAEQSFASLQTRCNTLDSLMRDAFKHTTIDVASLSAKREDLDTFYKIIETTTDTLLETEYAQKVAAEVA